MYVCIVGGEVSNSTRWTPIVTLPQPKATITRCDLSSRFFCIDATLLFEFENDKI